MHLPIVHSVTPYVFGSLAIGFCLFFLRLYFVATIPVVMAAFLCCFFRDPNRRSPEGNGLILAPCDGRVVRVSEHCETDSMSGCSSKTISIFMSPLDVHVNRAPVSGRIIRVSKIAGSFVPAFRKKASESNTKNIIGIDAAALKVFMVQVAGFLARRIDCRVKVGDFVQRGERIGMIRFGSRVDLILPEISGMTVLAEERAKVRAGETIVARWIA